MIILTEKEEKTAFAELMMKLSVTIFKESEKDVFNIIKTGPSGTKPEDYAEEIGLAVGQIVYDRMIELTKDMDRETMVKFFAQSLSVMCVERMNKDPHYKNVIMLASNLL